MNAQPLTHKVPLMRTTFLLPMLALALGGLGGPAQAQTAPGAGAAAAPVKPVFAIRGFDISGDNPLPGAETTRVLAPSCAPTRRWTRCRRPPPRWRRR
jgi:hypothetical protein